MNAIPQSDFTHKTRNWPVGGVVIGLSLFLPCLQGLAQVESGSDGRDGDFAPTSSVVIDMTDHPDGIYRYRSVDVPAGVDVSFVPNARNTPVIWLVQRTCKIAGLVRLSGQTAGGNGDKTGGIGGPGGYQGGNGGAGFSGGQGPGGALPGLAAAFGTYPFQHNGREYAPDTNGSSIYGNRYLLPLIGGSGGGGVTRHPGGGGGGGGALLIAASQTIELNGRIEAIGGSGSVASDCITCSAGAGSGGAVRLFTQTLKGSGTIDTTGGFGPWRALGGGGRVRVDVLDNQFGGHISGEFSQGFQPIILLPSGQGAHLAITSVAGVPIATSPTGMNSNPDVIIASQQANPIPITVSCVNIPPNSQITVSIKPANAALISVAGNNLGTFSSSMARVVVNLPRGGGLIYATAIVGIGDGASLDSDSKFSSYAQMGLTTSGERFIKMQITAALGGGQNVTYITASGQRYSLVVN